MEPDRRPGRVPTRSPSRLVAVGLTFVVCSVLTMLLTDEPAVGYGPATGGAIVVVVGLLLWRRKRRGEHPWGPASDDR